VNERQVRQTASQYLASARARASSVSTRTWLIAGAVILIAILGYWYFAGGSNSSKGGDKKSDGAPVRVAAVVRRDMPVVEHTLGTVVANTMVQVTARVEGVLDVAHFKEGQFVKKGDLLFEIDRRGFEAAFGLNRAHALLRDEAAFEKCAAR